MVQLGVHQSFIWAFVCQLLELLFHTTTSGWLLLLLRCFFSGLAWKRQDWSSYIIMNSCRHLTWRVTDQVLQPYCQVNKNVDSMLNRIFTVWLLFNNANHCTLRPKLPFFFISKLGAHANQGLKPGKVYTHRVCACANICFGMCKVPQPTTSWIRHRQ